MEVATDWKEPVFVDDFPCTGTCAADLAFLDKNSEASVLRKRGLMRKSSPTEPRSQATKRGGNRARSGNKQGTDQVALNLQYMRVGCNLDMPSPVPCLTVRQVIRCIFVVATAAGLRSSRSSACCFSRWLWRRICVRTKINRQGRHRCRHRRRRATRMSVSTRFVATSIARRCRPHRIIRRVRPFRPCFL